jgi:outer membrane protein assembly factor BamA
MDNRVCKFIILFSIFLVSPLINAHPSFQRPISRVDLGFNLGTLFQIQSKNQMGFLLPFNQNPQIPLNKRFRLGGFDDLRGFESGGISFDDRFDVDRMSYFSSSNDFIFWIARFIGIGVLYDLGNVYSTSALFSQDYATVQTAHGDRFRSNYGASLNLATPIGHLTTGLAYPHKPLAYEDSWRFFLNFTL